LQSFSKAGSGRQRAETSDTPSQVVTVELDLAEQGEGCRMLCPVPQVVTAASHGQRATVVALGYLDAS